MPPLRPLVRRAPGRPTASSSRLHWAAPLCLLALSACGPGETAADGASPAAGETSREGTLPLQPAQPGTGVPSGPASGEPPAAEGALPACPEGVLDAFGLPAMAPPKADSEGYRVPGPPRLETLRRSFLAALAGDVEGARAEATSAEYLLCRGVDAEAGLLLWRPPPGEGQAVVALRTGRARPVILEAPHPLHDSGTVEEAVHVFQQLGARALIVSGTHRCASAAPSSCSGTTTACGGGVAPFRLSDMAHTEESAYHTAHVALSEHFADDWVVALHGMGATGASVSDGTTLPTTVLSPSARVAQALASAFDGVTTCNAFGDFPRRNFMCGTTDVQGRHLNASGGACTQESPSSTGRFIHIEQSRTVRGEPEAVGEALDAVLPR